MARDELTNKISESVQLGVDAAMAAKALAQLTASYRAHSWPEGTPSFAFTPPAAGETEDAAFLRYQWEHMERDLALDLRPSNVPLIGPLLDALKRPLHQLVLHYVNRALAQAATADMIQARLIASLRQGSDSRGEEA